MSFTFPLICSLLSFSAAQFSPISVGISREGKCGEPEERYKDCGGPVRYYFHYNDEIGRCLIWTSSCLDVPQTYTNLKECEDTCYDSGRTLPCRNPLPNRTCDPYSDSQLSCPQGFQCKVGIPDPVCCETEEEEWFKMAYSTSCPGGRSAAIIQERGVDFPFISHICEELECPAGFECVEINDLFVKCCSNSDQQLSLGERLTTKGLPGSGVTEGPGQLPPFPPQPSSTELISTPQPRTDYCPGAFEEFLDSCVFGCGSLCPLSCENPEGEVTCRPGCSRACHCRAPFIRLNSLPDSPCILPHQCPDSRCKQLGEVYSECGSVCPESCSEPKKSCGDWCAPGCHCRSGLVRFQDYNPTSACVHPTQCNDPAQERRLGTIPPLLPRAFFTTEVCKPNSCPPNTRCIPVIEPCTTGKCQPFKCETAPSGPKETCPDPEMYWSDCLKPCIPACFGAITGLTCEANVCKPGCVCKLPYILLNAQNPFSPCVRIDLCPGKNETEFPILPPPTPSPTFIPNILKEGGRIIPVRPKPLVDCLDEKEECPMWAEFGLCSASSAWMLLHCQRSCQCCGCSPGDLINADNPDKCEDQQKMCPEWARNDQCKQNFAYMEVYCRKSCNICDPSPLSNLRI